VDEDDLAGNVQQAAGPIQGGVAATHHQHALVPEVLQVVDIIVDALALHALDVGNVEATGHKGADAGGDDDRAGEVGVARFGLELDQVIGIWPALDGARGSESDHLFVQANGGRELHRLLDLAVHKLTGQDLGKAGKVIDVLVGVEGGQLAAELGQAIDDLGPGIPQPCVKGGKEPGWPAPDDGDVVRGTVHRTAVRNVFHGHEFDSFELDPLGLHYHLL
jgi:hypothetical protein